MPLLGILDASNIKDICDYLDFITLFQQKVILRDYLCFCHFYLNFLPS